MFSIVRLSAALLLSAMFLSGCKGTSNEEREAYIRDYIQLVEKQAERIDTDDGRRGVPAVRIGVRNNGNKTLSFLSVKVAFLDEFGGTLVEHDVILVSEDAYRLLPLVEKELPPNTLLQYEPNTWKTFKDVTYEWYGKTKWSLGSISFQ